MTTTIVVEFRDGAGFEEFATELLEHGRAVLHTPLDVALLEELNLIVGFDDRAVRCDATVAHPRLRRPDGIVRVALTVRVDDDVRTQIQRMRRPPERSRTASRETELDEAERERTLSNTAPGAPTRAAPPVPDLFARADKDALTPLFNRSFEPPPATPVRAVRTLGAGPRETPPGVDTVPTRPRFVDTPANPAPSLAASGDADAAAQAPDGAPGGYRVVSRRSPGPDRAMRAQDYFEAARADIAAGALELARSNLSLAIAYDPGERAYRSLLADVERRLRVRSN